MLMKQYNHMLTCNNGEFGIQLLEGAPSEIKITYAGDLTTSDKLNHKNNCFKCA